ncbi:MAG: energy transducer TonB [Bacteroidota bacterium]
MKKHILLFVVLSFQINLFSQSTPPYFPQEQLIYSDCEKANASECLYGKVGQKVKSVLLEALQKHAITKDTLKVLIFFSVDKNGKINDGNYATVNDSLLSKNIEKSLNSIITYFQPFKVVNRKPKKYTSRHRLHYNYVTSKNEESSMALTPIIIEKEVYKGGQILEVPRYAGCKVKTEQQAKLCFQKSIQAHIRKHFRYPELAQETGLQGKVHILFVIDKDGYVTKIRTRGPHQILEEEAQRIARLIPRMTPAKMNGKPVKIPFAIPITFKLQ